MQKVKLNVTNENLIDFHHLLPLIYANQPFQFEVEEWNSADIEGLSFTDFRKNTTALNPEPELVPATKEYRMRPVAFGKPVGLEGEQARWTVKKSDPSWTTDEIRLQSPAPGVDRRLIEYTLTLSMKDGTRVAIDPPLDERRRR